MKAILFAAAAVLALSTATAFAGEGGGNGDRLPDPNTAPPGFFVGVPGYDAQRSAQAYVINQQDAWLAAHAANQTAQTPAPAPANG